MPDRSLWLRKKGLRLPSWEVPRKRSSNIYAGSVGDVASSFVAINSEIKSTKLKGDPLAPPDFIGNSWQGLTWRLGLGITDPTQPEEWQNHVATDTIRLTMDTYVVSLFCDGMPHLMLFYSVNRPEAIWNDAINLWWPDLQ